MKKTISIVTMILALFFIISCGGGGNGGGSGERERLVANFSASPRSGTAPLTVQFRNLSTGEDEVSWDFGDSPRSYSEVKNPTHTYIDPGTYTVRLYAYNSLETYTDIDVETKWSYITVYAPNTPVCTSGTPRSCNTGSQGICAAGTQICNGLGTGFGLCIQNQHSIEEVCSNGLDDDCNGLIDDLCTAEPSWGIPRLLISGGFRPSFSRDGSKIAYEKDSAIWVANANGSNQTRLTSTGIRVDFPEWSPDGSKIVYTRGEHKAGELWEMNANGTGQARRWFPEGAESPSYFSKWGEIVYGINNSSGTQEIRLTSGWSDSDGFIKYGTAPRTNFGTRPQCSPTDPVVAFSDDGEIYTFGLLDDLTPRLLTGNTSLYFANPAWSSDGSQIAVTAGSRKGIWVMDRNGTNLERVTTTGSIDIDPTWHENRIAFVRIGSLTSIYLVELK